MARRCKCGCRTEIKSASKCTNYMEKLGFATEECQQTAAITALSKVRAKNERKAKADKVKTEKADRARHTAAKNKVKTKAKWLAELQAVFNKYVRLRDAHLGCISCDKPKDWQGQWHASHYYSRGHSSSLRFNLWNVHKSCSVCNSHLSGNIGEYTPRLINKIGQDKFNWLLENKSSVRKYEVEWIKRAIKSARKAIRQMERRANN